MRPLVGARLPKDDRIAILLNAANTVGIPPGRMLMIVRDGEMQILFPVLPLEDE